MLLNSTTDPEETVYLKKSGIDRSIGYLVGGVLVLLFFLVYLVGLGRVQTRADLAVESRLPAPEVKSAEIGNPPDEAVNGATP